MHAFFCIFFYFLPQRKCVIWQIKRQFLCGMYTKHGPQVHGPPLWTRSMDPFMDPVHGLPLWTTPRFAKLQVEHSLDERGKWSSHLSREFKQWSLYRHLKNSGGSNGIRAYDLCDAGAMLYQLTFKATQLGAGLLGSFVPVKDFMNEMNLYLKSRLQTTSFGATE